MKLHFDQQRTCFATLDDLIGIHLSKLATMQNAQGFVDRLYLRRMDLSCPGVAHQMERPIFRWMRARTNPSD
ncbi:MAG: hypothetical protein ACXWSD_21165 [Bdellovibrionota bacterium]